MSTELDSKEVKDAIAAAVAEAVEEATAGLKAKNNELLGKLKKAQQGQQIDPSELQEVEAQRDQLKAELDKVSKAAKKAASDLEAANAKAEQAEGAMSKLLVDSGLSDALSKHGITNPVHQKAAKALLKEQVALVAEGDARIPKVGDKALADYVKEWAAGDEGKHFVTAPDGSGGGAGHSGKPAEQKQKGNWGGSKEERIAAIEANFATITE